jgi:hypothetical protein
MFNWKKSHKTAIFEAPAGPKHTEAIDETIEALRRLRYELEKLYGEIDLACQGIDLLEARLARSQHFKRTRLDGVTAEPKEFTYMDRQR